MSTNIILIIVGVTTVVAIIVTVVLVTTSTKSEPEILKYGDTVILQATLDNKEDDFRSGGYIGIDANDKDNPTFVQFFTDVTRDTAIPFVIGPQTSSGPVFGSLQLSIKNNAGTTFPLETKNGQLFVRATNNPSPITLQLPGTSSDAPLKSLTDQKLTLGGQALGVQARGESPAANLNPDIRKTAVEEENTDIELYASESLVDHEALFRFHKV